jgi:hypothetical protein
MTIEDVLEIGRIIFVVGIGFVLGILFAERKHNRQEKTEPKCPICADKLSEDIRGIHCKNNHFFILTEK